MQSGTLYIVASPIGNMQDITLRALEILKSVDVVCAEDTRVTTKVLAAHAIPHKKLISVNEFADAKKLEQVIELLQEGNSVAFLSDAGTPGISDPGSLLVSTARAAGVTIVPVPGVSAITALISVAGIRETPFLFYGFLPHKKGRQKILDTLLSRDESIVLYESPHRFIKLLEELVERDLENTLEVVVGRELTKIYEETLVDSPANLLAHYTTHTDTVRGEFVLIIRKVNV